MGRRLGGLGLARLWKLVDEFGGLLLVVAVGLALFIGLPTASRILDERRDGCRAQLERVCHATPVGEGGCGGRKCCWETVRRFAGTVLPHPGEGGFRPRSGDVRFRPDELPPSAVFVDAPAEDAPVILVRRPGPVPAPGTRLEFCALPDFTGSWLPLAGYEAGRGGGPVYGPPAEGVWQRAEWLMDMPRARGWDRTGGDDLPVPHLAGGEMETWQPPR